MESEAANPVRSESTDESSASRIPSHPLPRQRAPRLTHEGRVTLLALASGAGGVALALVLLWTGDHDPNTRWSLALLVTILWLSFAFALRSAVIRPLQTLANVQSALREGDFSFRVRGAKGGALGELMLEVNTLSDLLREQRLGAMEASALLTTVMTEIDVAVFAFDGEKKLRLVNRAGERLMAQNAERLLGKTAANSICSSFLKANPRSPSKKTFPVAPADGACAVLFFGRAVSHTI